MTCCSQYHRGFDTLKKQSFSRLFKLEKGSTGTGHSAKNFCWADRERYPEGSLVPDGSLVRADETAAMRLSWLVAHHDIIRARFKRAGAHA